MTLEEVKQSISQDHLQAHLLTHFIGTINVYFSRQSFG